MHTCYFLWGANIENWLGGVKSSVSGMVLKFDYVWYAMSRNLNIKMLIKLWVIT